MVLTSDVELPCDEELEIDEVNMSTAALIAASNFVGKRCEELNNEFMLCRSENPNDPRPCISLGMAVTKCSRNALRVIKANCMHEFNQYANCIDKSSGDYRMWNCRKTEGVYNKCLKDKLCFEVPHWGYFTRGRIHKPGTLQPLPNPPCPCKPDREDRSPSLPDCQDRPPSRFTSRLYWLNE